MEAWPPAFFFFCPPGEEKLPPAPLRGRGEHPIGQDDSDVTRRPAPSPSGRAFPGSLREGRAGSGRRPPPFPVLLRFTSPRLPGDAPDQVLLMAADVFMCSPRRPRSRGRSVLLKPQVPEDDDDSDTDEPSPPPPSGVATSARAHASAAPLPPRAGPGREEPPRRQQIIHSGHFMVSSPHREHPPKKGYDFDTVNKQTCQTYSFGKTSSCHLSIDASLTKLFECMTLAYR